MILSIDCDLRQSYGVTDDGKAARAPHPITLVDQLLDEVPPGTVLFEIASPVSFNRGGQSSAIMHNLAKWAIWNVACATEIAVRYHMDHRILVCPSNVWTKGYDLKTRHLIAGCKQPKKDLRECECMLWFFKQDPTPWLPLHEYLARI